MDNEISYTYDAKSEGNILVVGKLVVGKQLLYRILVKIKCSVTLRMFYGYLKTTLSAEQDKNISDCFVDQDVDFKYLADIEEFDDILDLCQIKKPGCKENFLEENIAV